MAGGGGGGAESGSSHTPSTVLAEYLLVALIVSSLLLEAALHRLERWIATRHLHLQAVLRNLYRELMVLGLVSFVFITYEASTHPSSETIASFEFAHVFIFLLAIIHTLVVLVTVLASLSLSKRWRLMEQMDLVRYLELKEEFRRYRARRHEHHGIWWRRVQWWLPDPRRLFRYWRLHEIMAFHDIRFQFLYYRDLPEDFNFSSYLRKLKAVIFIDLVDAHWSLWLVFLFIVVADIVRRKVWDNSKFEGAFAITASLFLTASTALLAWKIRRVSWALTKHPATYFNHVSKETVLETLASSRRPSLPSASPPAIASDADDERTDAGEPATSSSLDGGGATRSPSSSPPPGMQPLQQQVQQDPEAAATTWRSGDGAPVAPFRVSGASRPSFEASRITNLVYSSRVEFEPGAPLLAGTTPSGERAAGKASKRKPRRVPEPPTPTAEQLMEIAEMHSLATRTGTTEGRRRSLDGSASATPSHATPSVSGAASPMAPGQSRVSLDASMPTREGMDDMLFVPVSAGEGETGVVRVSMEGVRAGSGSSNGGTGSSEAGARVSSPGRRRSLDGRPSFDGRNSQDRRRSWDGRREGRRSLDGRPSGGRRSVELASAFPVDELADRDKLQVGVSHIALDVGEVGQNTESALGETGGDNVDGEPREPSRRALPRISRDVRRPGKDSPTSREARAQQVRQINASLVKHAEQTTSARQQKAGAEYPKVVTTLIPRLRRVASTAEKLFWFGSHRFFLWCVEFVLFFATVLLASTTSSMALVLLGVDGDGSITGLNIAAICSSFATLLYVLMRISYVMKKYTFVLNNTGLVPEALALQVIHNVHQKRQLINQMYADAHDDASASESDSEASEAARERRRKFSRFFTSEVQTSGHIAGADDTSDDKKIRSKLLGNGARLRRRRRAPPQDIPLVPNSDRPVNDADSE